jgi:hypothetical protein
MLDARRALGHAEKREKASSTTRTVKWQSAPEITSREQCERMNRDPRSKYEYRWMDK